MAIVDKMSGYSIDILYASSIPIANNGSNDLYYYKPFISTAIIINIIINVAVVGACTVALY